MVNPYLEKFNEACREGDLTEQFSARMRLVREYAWAVPDSRALETVAQYSPLIEIGAGTGYWASLLEEMGADILAYDIVPPDGRGGEPASGETPEKWIERGLNWYHRGWASHRIVQQGGPEKVKLVSPDVNLFLCWPPLDNPMAEEALSYFQGRFVIHVGEEYGCTATPEFHEALEKDFKEVKRVNLPQWLGVHDYLTVWRRR